MWPVTPQWLDAVGRSHGQIVTVDAVRDGEHLGRVPFESAKVQVTSGNRVHRTLTLVTAEELYPQDAAELLSPFGTELFVQYTLTGVDGRPIGPAVPVFTGGIDEPARVLRSGKMELKASDRMADINAAKFLAPRVGPTGQPVPSAIRTLIQEVIPQSGVADTTGSQIVVVPGIMWPRDRGAAVDELATSIGAEVVALPDGSFLTRPVPTILDPPVWYIGTGADGVIVADVASMSRRNVRNAWVISGERPDGSAPILATVLDDNPTSATRWDGPLRQRPGFWSSPLVQYESQGQIAGLAKLSRSLGLARQRRITCPPNPALDGGDVVSITVDGATEVHIVDDIDLGLTPEDAAMTFGSRSAEEPGE